MFRGSGPRLQSCRGFRLLQYTSPWVSCMILLRDSRVWPLPSLELCKEQGWWNSGKAWIHWSWVVEWARWSFLLGIALICGTHCFLIAIWFLRKELFTCGGSHPGRCLILSYVPSLLNSSTLRQSNGYLKGLLSCHALRVGMLRGSLGLSLCS